MISNLTTWGRGRRAWREVKKEGLVCAICGKPFLYRREVTIDHIYPKSRGGELCQKNLQYAHAHCNEKKADLIPWPYCRPEDHPWESFAESVYGVVRRIPRGKVATYRQIAALLGNPYLAGAVAQVLRRTEEDQAVPRHRVVGTHGELAEYFGVNGVYDHRKMLRREKITIYDDLRVRLEIYQW